MNRDRKNILLVIFDMDGVVFEGKNFWLDLHRHFGTQEQGVASADKYLSADYDRLVKIVAGNLWKGRPAGPYFSLVAERKYQPGVKRVFQFLNSNRILTAIISSGPFDLALRAKNELGVDEIRANRLEIKDGQIAGSMEIMVPDAEKRRVGMDLMESLHIEPSRAMYIGDSDSDVELAEIVGMSAAYDSISERLNEVCDIRLKYGELGKLTTLINN